MGFNLVFPEIPGDFDLIHNIPKWTTICWQVKQVNQWYPS